MYAALSLPQFPMSKPTDDHEAGIITTLISKLKAAAPKQIPTSLSQIHFLCFAPVPNARSWQQSLCDVANACIFLCLRSRSCNISVPSAGALNGLSVVKLTGFLLRCAAVDTCARTLNTGSKARVKHACVLCRIYRHHKLWDWAVLKVE